MVGIWRLTPKKSLPQISPDVSSPQDEKGSQKKNIKSASPFGLVEKERDVLLMLREDRSFVQYGKMEGDIDEKSDTAPEGDDSTGENENSNVLDSIIHLGKLQGIWDYRDGKLILATDRPPNSNIKKVHDTILMGKVLPQIKESSQSDINSSNLQDDDQSKESSESNEDEPMKNEADIHLAILEGEISTGRFIYPKTHPSFFDQPIFKPTITGTFELYQTLGSIKIRPRSTKKESKVELFKRKEFYNKKFLLTTMPVEPKRGMPKLVWKRSEGRYVDENKSLEGDASGTVDIRVMPIEFYANNTFCAMGTNKILRGRFEITGEEKDQLWFAVSLFGSGRSVSGSIYSEGKGLTHDDKRSYLGVIERKETEDPTSSDSAEDGKLFVKGSAVFGSDLGTDARPEPVAGFTMLEVTEESQVDDDDLNDCAESIFE